jgi:mRNA interferase MazF
MSLYIPDRGDYVWLNFTPQSGHKQRGIRPAIIISRKEYNAKTGLAICCPITSKIKGYPFEVKISSDKINGVILSDQIRKLDWKARYAEKIDQADIKIINQVIKNLELLIA